MWNYYYYFFQFLSMKLATVNPRLDFNLEGLLTKEVCKCNPVPAHGGIKIEFWDFVFLVPKKNCSSLQILQSRAGPSSTLGYSHDMTHMTMPFAPLHPSQPGVPVMANSSDALRRSINTQLAAMSEGYKEPSSQVHLLDLFVFAIYSQTSVVLLHIIKCDCSRVYLFPFF